MDRHLQATAECVAKPETQSDAGWSVLLGYGSIFLFLSQEYEMGYMKSMVVPGSPKRW